MVCRNTHWQHLFWLFRSDTSLSCAEHVFGHLKLHAVWLCIRLSWQQIPLCSFFKVERCCRLCQTCTAFPQHQQLWMKSSVRLSCLSALWETQCLPRDCGLSVIKQNCGGQLVFHCFSGTLQPTKPTISDIQILYIDTDLVKTIEENHYHDVRTSMFQKQGRDFGSWNSLWLYTGPFRKLLQVYKTMKLWEDKLLHWITFLERVCHTAC